MGTLHLIRRCIFITLAVSSLGTGCDRNASGEGDNGGPVVVTTTTVIHDAAQRLAGSDFEVRGLMKPGGDPHLYKPTPSDARAVAGADLVVINGLSLEGWAEDLVRGAGGRTELVVATEGIEPIRMDGMAGGVDPHVWLDVGLWQRAVARIADALERHAPSPQVASRVRAREATLLQELDALDLWVRERLRSVPAERRVLVTSHHAFNYFGRAYDVEVVGIQGLSTEEEASQRDVADTIELVKARGIPAVFVESSVNPALIRQVARETGAKVAGPLYTDSVGPVGSDAGTYVGMIGANVRILVEALEGDWAPFESGGQG